jgi:hypothetical protein
MRLVQYLVLWLFMGSAHAHLLDAQKGTLNLETDRAYLAISISVTAFEGIDDDGDGLLSSNEFNAHFKSIETQIKNGIQLSSPKGPIAINELVITVSVTSDKPIPERQLLVLGQYPIAGVADGLQLKVQLFGKQADETRQYITATRGTETQLLTLSPETPQRDVFPSQLNIWKTQIQLGVQHILEGTDHLLFLLVVLSAEKSLLSILSVLTAFTIGHAITLVICNGLGWTAPSAVVEPAIAATIVCIALWDLRLSKSGQTHSILKRLGLVFACSIIHGLGLADAFTDLGLTGSGKLISLAGFNIGIELGQLGVAFMAVLGFQAVSKYMGAHVVSRMKHFFLFFAVLLGSWWFGIRALGA